MSVIANMIRSLEEGRFDKTLKQAYPRFEDDKQKVYARMRFLLSGYGLHFDEPQTLKVFSAPGRVEVGGNHTDHQHGCVLAGAVDADSIAAACENGTRTINIFSEGYGLISVTLDILEPVPEEKETTASLIRGVATELTLRGYTIRGFNAFVTSEVLSGSGISSSAAFEVLLGTIMNGLFCDGEVDPVQIAIIGQKAENIFFGKPSGLMDQMSSAVGSFVSIDFKDPSQPVINKITFDLEKSNLALYVINSGASHADLTSAYAEIPQEMNAVAAFFGKKVLRDVDEELFWENITAVREQTGDRAILRAIHYYDDNRRALEEAAMLRSGDTDSFLRLLNESGDSSFMHLQNVSVCGRDKQQGMAFALAVAKKVLQGHGACRVMGGGFAGTIQAFVPLDLAETFVSAVDRILGNGACRRMSIRNVGCTELF